MGTTSVTGVNGMHCTASGHQKGCTRSHVTTVQHRKSSAPSLGFRCPSRSAGNQWRMEGLGKRVGWKWSQRLSWKGVGPGVGDRKSPPPWWGIRELLREKNGYLKRIAPSLDGGWGAGEDD